jgi:RNAse (barnase) inhibitor barstar
MREIRLDGSRWRNPEDFYDGLLPALGAPEWHGRNLDALNDTIAGGDINAVNPPFAVRITGAGAMSDEARRYVARFVELVADLRAGGIPVDASLQ